MAVKYNVHLPGQPSVVIEAETINIGINRLWFFDRENHLIAVFKWQNILGFSSEGPLTDQKTTDLLLHEKKTLGSE